MFAAMHEPGFWHEAPFRIGTPVYSVKPSRHWSRGSHGGCKICYVSPAARTRSHLGAVAGMPIHALLKQTGTRRGGI